ncbi:YhgE/Pip family protein [Lysinimonas soli]|uniref:YhgE/Pip family protein n=1 Tax=Lysinimonas soli TaxID=1074233 RepID=A0ABW0NQY0_9MICO
MTVPALIRAELARLVATPLARLALVALMLVPVLYGGLYLWANRDPYASLERVPAALVVLDTGSSSNGTTVNYGRDVAAQVIKNGSFDWHEVSAKEAAAGVKRGTYDFSVTFPASFSADLTSSDITVGANGAAVTEPRKADIRLVTNDTNSYLASTIATQAATTIRTSIASQVSREAAGRFLLALSDVRGSLSTAVDGASRLVDGTSTAQSGAQSLASGTASLASGASQVAAGTAKLAATGHQAVAAGNSMAAQIPALRSQLAAQLTADGLTQTQIDALLAQLDPLAAKAGSAQSQLSSLAAQVDQLNAGAQQVSSGAAQAHTGASSLAAGLGELRSGATTLHDGLANGVARIPNTDAAQREAVSSTIGDPAAVTRTAVTKAQDYGAGLAPFFISLAAWIGIYALFLIVKPLSRRALTAVQRPLRVTLAGWLTPGILGLLQMVAVFLIVTLALGFTVANPIGALAFMVLISLTFAAIILALNVWLGSVGQFLGLVLMVVQLVTAGGTFPWQTLPAPLAALHHVLPMSFGVDGLRQLMYGGSLDTALSDAGVLLLWLGVAFTAAALGATRMTRFRTLRDLRPSLIG